MKIILGTMTWGRLAQTDLTCAVNQIRACQKYFPTKKVCLDTARMYQSGETEELIGKILCSYPQLKSSIEIHSKASPTLTNDGIKKQFEQTLLALGVDKLDIFYIHMPDISVNIEEIFHTCNELYSQGLFNTLGISNFASWDVVRIHHLCNTRGWVVPKVYQGCYNALNTSVEHELLPALRTLNMSFYSYNPLAAGLLTGRYTAIEDFYAATTGRFSKEFDFVPKDNHDEQFRTIKGKAAEIYRDRYGSQNNFKAVKLLNEAKEPSDKLSNLSLRWLRHHSRLRAHFEDAIIFGASKIKQAEENLLSLTSGRLSSDMVEAFKESNQLTKAEAEPYFRNYDKKPGFADEFLNQYD